MSKAKRDDASDTTRASHAALTREIARAIARLEKRSDAVRKDLTKIQEAEKLGAHASWFVAAAAKSPRGAKALRVSDWSSGEEKFLEVPLDPARAPREQVEAMFVRARRLRAGRPVAERRLAESESLAETLRALSIEAASIDVDSEDAAANIDDLHARAQAAAPREIRASVVVAKRTTQERSLAYRTFIGSGDVKILVGRGASQNDELTFQVARPHHAWLHARGDAGAHVIVCIKKGGELSSEQLVDAAHLAAHFSKARGEAVVDVSYTYRRYVRKPRKSPPGLVMLDREKVVSVRVEPARLAKLLATERASRIPDKERSVI